MYPIAHTIIVLSFTASPLMLIFPPVRNFSLFVQNMEDFAMESLLYPFRFRLPVHRAWLRLLDCLLGRD
ncbi:hypothetical protein SAY87_026007 [Trapa incisa]|uniref:Uncharacterized protein n=1 Tax=Trapa incisa TaxID=236973 RepID=A0AAN7GT07_9MYRT|nr:hypothetical protein SAY87_026007 [Trapa incisa]